jgi:hypothetical protein
MGRYSVPGVHEGTELALMVTGHVCLVSAALAHGWKVKVVPAVPQVAVPKDRRVDEALRSRMSLSWIDLDDTQVEGLATNATTTLAMCGRRLPFESVLRAIAIDVPGLEVEPQVTHLGRARPERPRGPGRSPPADRRRGGLLRVARRPHRPAARRTTLRPPRRQRLDGAPLLVGGRHARPGLRPCGAAGDRRTDRTSVGARGPRVTAGQRGRSVRTTDEPGRPRQIGDAGRAGAGLPWVDQEAP